MGIPLVEGRDLTVENGNYRETTGELAQQIQSLEGVIDDLGSRSALDPAQASAIAKLPAVVKNRAVGGTSQTNAAISNVLSTSLVSPDDTFGVLRTLGIAHVRRRTACAATRQRCRRSGYRAPR